MMFVNKRDSLRKDYDIKSKNADKCINKGQFPFSVPIPAVGETVHMIREKSPEVLTDSVEEMDRLLKNGFLRIEYLRSGDDLYNVAKDLCTCHGDDRDIISPMDALITATATVDPECNRLYTTDSKLISNVKVSQIIDDWRDSQDYPKLTISDISSVLKVDNKRY